MIEPEPNATPEWPCWGVAFSCLAPGNGFAASGRATPIEDDARFSNAYGKRDGAVTVDCKMDLRTMKVREACMNQFN